MTNLAKIDSDFEKVEICIVVNRMSMIGSKCGIRLRVEICQGRAAKGCLEMMTKMILGRFGKTVFKEGHVQGCLEEGYDIILNFEMQD